MAILSADMKTRAELSIGKLIQTFLTLTFIFPRQKTINVLLAAVAARR